MGRQDNSQPIEKRLLDLANEKPRRYSHEELMNFTSNLENKVGSGGFGDVYKGKLTNGVEIVEIAVKVLQEKSNEIMINQFWAEVSTMSRTYHPNLIKLYGYCFDESNMIALVYEYMEIGSLDTLLFNKDIKIEWVKLYDIAIEIAHGLSYLHDLRPQIIHYDVKAGNVLLDLNLSPKIIDFGLARYHNKDMSQVEQSGFRGTKGFAALEVGKGYPVTHKSDVYSFGMMLFEILRREKNSVGSSSMWFPGEVAVKFEQDQLDTIIMDCGIEEKDKQKAEKLSIVALWCTQIKPQDRPDMSSVVKILQGEIPLQTPPNPFPFYDSPESSLSGNYTRTDRHGALPKFAPPMLNEKLSYKNYENQIVNIPPKPMSEHVAISFAKENVDALINCVKQDIGFSQGIPVAAFTIHRCLVYWRSFEAENTSVFDRLIQMIGSAIENQEKNDRMAYWLSNTSSLLFLLQKTGLDTVRQVEAKYPALLFKQQLTAFVEKIYRILRDNLKKELKPSLSLCLQVPKMSRGSTLGGSGRSSGNNSPTSYWHTIIESLHSLLSILQQDFVPPVLIRKIFTQIFSYINVQLFNSLLLLRQECFSFSYVEYVKYGLDKLELWCSQAKEEYAGSSWDEVKHIRQAVAFLLIQPKSRISYDEITNDICPVLSVQHLLRICNLCWDDKFNTQNVSLEVISRIREETAQYSYSAVSKLLWLEDDSRIPFSADDISNSLREKDFSKVKPAAKLLENPAFEFLQE